MKKTKTKQRDMYKTTVKVLAIILILAIFANIIYAGGLYIRKSMMTDELKETVDNTVSECTDILNSFGIDETQQEYIDIYKQNMENCQTELERAYIANAMLTYSITTTNLANSNELTDLYNSGGIGQSKSHYVDELSALSQELQNAIYNYTIYDENN